MLEQLKQILSNIFHLDDALIQDKKFQFYISMESLEQAQEILVEILNIKHPKINCEIFIDKKDPRILSVTIFCVNNTESIKTLVEAILRKEKEIKNRG